MMKKLLSLGLIVFIALIAMSYVNAEHDITVDEVDDEISDDIPLTDNENKMLKDGKEIKKDIKIKKKA